MANVTGMHLDLGGIFVENSTYSYEDYVYKEDCPSEVGTGLHFGTVFLPMLYSLTLFLGLLGNGLVLAVLIQRKQRWSVTDTFILHLAVADILLLLTLPFWAVQAVWGWSFGTPFCKITGAIFTINFYCGIFLLACISLDRYLSVVHGVQMYSRKKPLMVQASCLTVWLFSIFLSIPDWYFLESVNEECVHNYLKLSQSGFDWRLSSRLLYHIVGFLLPSFVLLFCYSYILQRLLQGSQGVQKQKVILALALVLVFFICWTPYNITLMADTFEGKPEHSEAVAWSCENKRAALENSLAVTFALACLHTCLNPVLYLGLCRNFYCRVLHMVRCAQGVPDHPRLSLWDSSVVVDTNEQAEENGRLNQIVSIEQVQSIKR